jgi:hypothetical protein
MAQFGVAGIQTADTVAGWGANRDTATDWKTDCWKTEYWTTDRTTGRKPQKSSGAATSPAILLLSPGPTFLPFLISLCCVSTLKIFLLRCGAIATDSPLRRSEPVSHRGCQNQRTNHHCCRAPADQRPQCPVAPANRGREVWSRCFRFQQYRTYE